MKTGFTHESTHNESQEWYTPPEIFTALGLTFDLDPCAAPPPFKDFVPAINRLTYEHNGLIQRWHGLIFMNPPYGTETPKWMKRFVEHGNGIALVFSRTDTQWFHHVVPHALCCFIKGRIRFRKPDGTIGGTPGAGSLLLAIGKRSEDALQHSGLGICMKVIKSSLPHISTPQ